MLEYTRNLEIMTITRSFRAPKSVEEEKELLEESIPKSTQNVNKWAVKIFADWQTTKKKNGKRYPARTLYSIACGIQRHTQENIVQLVLLDSKEIR